MSDIRMSLIAKGFVFYRGPSVLDGAPIMAVATLESSNAKTGPKGRGNMVQTWILRADVDPVSASKSGDDASICGACPHRHHLGGACYVNIGQAPGAVYRAAHRGSYKELDIAGSDSDALIASHLLWGRAVRLGAYGDPAAIPFDVWAQLLDGVEKWTGYTHQARHPRFDARLFRYCMASADTPKQAEKLNQRGARTFRVKPHAAPMLRGELECLSDTKGAKCIDCGLCDGANRDAPSIVINVHGSRSGRFNASLGGAQLIARATA
jgi:hypothetical protein